ncbi:hypothetical protein [Bacillus mycoides]|uniref:hypothetical protein n=1 Tax=Bacillus mycoides TaxID=1405 RepID=UPI003A807E99
MTKVIDKLEEVAMDKLWSWIQGTALQKAEDAVSPKTIEKLDTHAAVRVVIPREAVEGVFTWLTAGNVMDYADGKFAAMTLGKQECSSEEVMKFYYGSAAKSVVDARYCEAFREVKDYPSDWGSFELPSGDKYYLDFAVHAIHDEIEMTVAAILR